MLKAKKKCAHPLQENELHFISNKPTHLAYKFLLNILQI